MARSLWTSTPVEARDLEVAKRMARLPEPGRRYVVSSLISLFGVTFWTLIIVRLIFFAHGSARWIVVAAASIFLLLGVFVIVLRSRLRKALRQQF